MVWKYPWRGLVHRLPAGVRDGNCPPEGHCTIMLSDVHNDSGLKTHKKGHGSPLWSSHPNTPSPLVPRSPVTATPVCWQRVIGRGEDGACLASTRKKPNSEPTFLLWVPPAHHVWAPDLPLQYRLLTLMMRLTVLRQKLSTEFCECQDSGFQTPNAASMHRLPGCSGWATCGAEMYMSGGERLRDPAR